jgi:dephospho-CoA kinase
MNIALTGKMRAGKDSVAEYLTQKYGYTRFAFGDELKRYAHELFGESPNKPRELYQWFGQTMRERDPDIWTRKCFDNITPSTDMYAPITAEYERLFKREAPEGLRFRVVISDLRQPNEYARCRAENYVIVGVSCPDDIRLERARAAGDSFTSADLAHETESHVDTFAVDYEINNGGTLAELHAQIDRMMTWLSHSVMMPREYLGWDDAEDGTIPQPAD